MFAILSGIVLYIGHHVRTTKNNNVGEQTMLPRKLYESLPFFYMFTGVVCAVLIDSTIVLISSMLLIVTGIFVLLMRRNFRKSLNRSYELHKAAYQQAVEGGFERRSGNERRQREVVEWPLLDDAGGTVFSDRRIGERRVSTG
jgi:hypothetical protein